MKTLILLLFLQFSTQYGIMEIHKGRWEQIGYISVYKETLWLKFDYSRGEEFEVIFEDERTASTTYFVRNEKAYGSVKVDNGYIYINLFIKNVKEHYNKKFTRKGYENKRN